MATEKKKEVDVKDLKPKKDAKGGVARRQTNSNRGAANPSTVGRVEFIKLNRPINEA